MCSVPSIFDVYSFFPVGIIFEGNNVSLLNIYILVGSVPNTKWLSYINN